MDNTTKTPYIVIGQRINTLLAETNTTQKDLAELLGVKPNIISYYCGGYRQPSLTQLSSIADHFDTTIDYLIGRTNVKTQNREIKMICEYTGLSEKVVNTIVSEKQPHIAWIETLNALLENRDFILLITLISEKLSIDEEEISVSHAGLHTHATNIDLIDYNISNSIKKITDDIKSSIPKDETQSVKLNEWMKNKLNFNEKGT